MRLNVGRVIVVSSAAVIRVVTKHCVTTLITAVEETRVIGITAKLFFKSERTWHGDMAATKLTADGLLSTEETSPVIEDSRMDTDMSNEEEEALLSEDQCEDVGASEDSISNAQRQKRKRETTDEPRKPERKTKEPLGSERTSNDRGRKRHRETPPD